MSYEQGPKSPEAPDSEEFLSHAEDEREVVNDRLGFAYQESIIAVPEARREEYGISRITRRKITKMPEGLELLKLREISKLRPKNCREWFDSTKLPEIIHEASDGLFPGLHTWSHALGGFYGDDSREKMTNRYKLERLFLQEIYPKEAYDYFYGWKKDPAAGKFFDRKRRADR